MTIGKINVDETLKSAEALLLEDKTSSPQVRAMLQLLVTLIHLLVAKLGLDSNNSSKPPSMDPNRKRGSKAKKSGKKPGGQNGHEGSTLGMVDNPDVIKVINLDRSTLPRGKYHHVGFETRQVIDIEIKRVVTEYRAEILQDRDGKKFVAPFPQGVERSAQYGPDLKAHAVYMSQFQLIPYDRIQDYFADQCSISLSTGSLFNFNKEAYTQLEGFAEIAVARLIASKVLHVDETGINIGGRRLWLHSASSQLWTLFHPHEKRGGDAMTAMGILQYFRGILVHDHWKPYFQFLCAHALCNAHHLRELERAWEDDKQQWAKDMQDLLVIINDDVAANGGSLTLAKAEHYRRKYLAILSEGDKECPAPNPKSKEHRRGRQKKSKSRNLLERLFNFENETLRFMTDVDVPFTNNQGENDIRMTKVQQKISGCFRAMEGAQIFCRVRSYLSTCRKHEVAATQALKLLFSGKLPDFIPKLE